MKMQKTMTEWIRLVATPEDKALLLAITARRSNDGFADTVRQLIREEAARKGIAVVARYEPLPHAEQAA
jgi:hypothetical protein